MVIDTIFSLTSSMQVEGKSNHYPLLAILSPKDHNFVLQKILKEQLLEHQLLEIRGAVSTFIFKIIFIRSGIYKYISRLAIYHFSLNYYLSLY